jgi:hypothetical protein
MLNRLIRFALIGVFATAIAGYGVAYADNGDEDTGEEPGFEEDTGLEGEGEAAAEPEAEAEPEATEAEAEEPAAEEEVAAGHLLAKGKIGVNLAFEMNLSADAVGKPFGVGPDIVYGVMPKLNVGVVHSAYTKGGFPMGTGLTGLCLAGEDNGCAEVYDSIGVNAWYGVLEGELEVNADAGLYVRSFDPMTMSLKLGVDVYKVMGKITIMAKPAVFIGLTERDFNKEELFVPVGAMYEVAPKIDAGVITGIGGLLDGFGDTYYIPVAVAGQYAVTPQIDAGLAFALPNIGGEGSSADYRTINVFVGWHN